ncbi:MAG: hypothetical protein LBT95_09495 [Treponema sp.]|jgi:hypothetical protein|nr:hypothetical protein [Treponema sp.]
MMKKPVFPRIIGLLFLYGAVFVAIVMIQFTKQGGFTRRIGDFVITGQYRAPEAGDMPGSANKYFLQGGIRIFFGGLEFSLTGDDDGFGFVKTGGERDLVLPGAMVLSGEGVVFSFPGGTELSFSTQYIKGKPELRISARLDEETEVLELPYKPLKTSRIQDDGEGQFLVLAEGENYTFGHSSLDNRRQVLLLNRDEPGISYWAVPEKNAFGPEDFIISQARDKQEYENALNRWREQNYSLWNRLIANASEEDLIIAYEAESLRRGTYRLAQSAVPAAFLTGNQKTFRSSVFLGQMTAGLRSLSAFEREKIGRLSRLLNEKSLDFLKEPNVFEFFALRDYGAFIDDGAALVSALDPLTLTADISPGIIEGFVDWQIYRPRADNPFARLIDQACFLISERMRRDAGGELCLVFLEEAADPLFNLRLGKALVAYGESAREEPWAALGRSLILSVLSLENAEGTFPGGLLLSETGEPGENGGLPRQSAALIYRVLAPGDYFPRAAPVNAGTGGLWAWTAASALRVVQTNGILDIAVSFPVGETHYMILRGVKPFAKIQLYDMDFRTDPQFERYDSSGWVYSAQEQTLLLKMKHRSAVEHIRLFYL